MLRKTDAYGISFDPLLAIVDSSLKVSSWHVETAGNDFDVVVIFDSLNH
jgi:hypothetical protein